MATTYKGLTIEINAETKKLTAALSEASKGSRTLQNELKQIDRALDFNPNSAVLLTRKIELMSEKVSQTTDRLKVLKEAESQIGKDGMSSDQWTKLQAEIATTENKLENFQAELSSTQAKYDLLGNSVYQAGARIEAFGSKISSAGKTVESIGSGLSNTVTPAIVAGSAATIVAATNIDTALTGVKKTVDGTEEQYQDLKEAAIEFSQTNAVSPSQLLDIQALGAQLGFTIDELDEFSEVVSGLDIATNMDAETAATQMAQFANITKMSHDEISNYGSAIVGLGNNFATTEADINNMAMRLAAAGTQVGMSQADILGLSTALSSLGVEAEAGGSAVSTIMSNIDKAVATNGDSLQAWASAAQMSAADFTEAWKSDPAQALSAVLAGLQSATEAGGNMSLMLEELGINELRQTDSMKRMAGNSDLLTQAINEANVAWTENTALQTEVDNRNESLAAKFEMLKNRAVAIADSVGGPLADALLDIVDAAEPLIQAIADGATTFAEMDESQQRVILTVVGLSAALGPLLNLFGRGMQAVEPFGKAVQALAEHFSKVKPNISSAAAEINGLGNSGKKGSKGINETADSIDTLNKKSSIAKSAIRGVGGVIATLIVGSAISSIQQYCTYLEDVKMATDGLRSSMSAYEAYNPSQNFNQSATSASGYAKSLQEVVAQQAQFAQTSIETWSEVNGQAAAVDSFAKTIADLTSKQQLNKDEQQQLAAAVAGYNEVTGESVSIVNAQSGELSASTDQILANANAWKINAESQALQQELVDLYKNLHDAQAQVEEKTNAVAAAQEKYNQAVEASKSGLPGTAEQLTFATNELAKANGELSTANDLVSSGQEAIDQRTAKLGELTLAQSGTTQAIQDWINANSELSTSLESVDVTKFSNSLSQLGFSTQQLNQMGTASIQSLAANFDGSLNSLISACESAGIEIPGKISDGIYAGAGGAYLAAGSLAAQVYSELTGVDYTQTGVFVAQGMAGGIESDLSAQLAAAGLGQDVIDALLDAIDAHSPSRKADEAGRFFNQGFAQGISGDTSSETAAQSLGQRVLNALLGKVGEFLGIGSQSGANYAAGVESTQNVANSAGSIISSSVSKALSNYGTFSSHGSSAGGNYANGIGSAQGSVRSKASSLNSAASGQLQNNNAWTWGNHLGSNFAAGISSAIGLVRSAANTVANAVTSILGHSIPDDGPLRNNGKGEAEWGAHMIQNYMDGARSQIPAVRKTMSQIALVAGNSLSGSNTAIPNASKQASNPAINVVVNVDGNQTPNNYQIGSVTISSESSDSEILENFVDMVLRMKGAV